MATARLPQGGRAFVVSTTVVSIHAFRGEGDFGDGFPRRQFHCTTGVKKRAAHSNRAQPATSNRAARRNAPDDPPPLSPFAVVFLVLLVFPSSACRTSKRAARRNAPDDPPHFLPHPPFPAAPCGDSLFREMQTMQAYCKHIALACAVNAAFACMQRDAMHA